MSEAGLALGMFLQLPYKQPQRSHASQKSPESVIPLLPRVREEGPQRGGRRCDVEDCTRWVFQAAERARGWEGRKEQGGQLGWVGLVWARLWGPQRSLAFILGIAGLQKKNLFLLLSSLFLSCSVSSCSGILSKN